ITWAQPVSALTWALESLERQPLHVAKRGEQLASVDEGSPGIERHHDVLGDAFEHEGALSADTLNTDDGVVRGEEKGSGVEVRDRHLVLGRHRLHRHVRLLRHGGSSLARVRTGAPTDG